MRYSTCKAKCTEAVCQSKQAWCSLQPHLSRVPIVEAFASAHVKFCGAPPLRQHLHGKGSVRALYCEAAASAS